ncbi:sensor histidine kinase [Roseateles saccharophilus]|uniref:histidine kinase n=1 Tax=Roseateles saccharophilus TaxID=304 RepID=A0A4R3VIY9_ROSSA|nr:sensor histidine kinase N-terminal domain-containing protein [Roseateles saccharophilus]MDG0832787.1 histidine kinase [Roseateles saccharophilus]TCV03852.1 two-component system sensor histidine kinase TctE [Roseateles saccharophilus]
MSPEPSSARASLRRRLIRHVTLPLLLTWGLGSALALGIASYFTQRAFDRAMLDDAYLLSAHLAQQDGHWVLNMSADDIRTVLYDQSEMVYFAVQGLDGHLIAGHAGLHPPPAEDDSADTRYTDLNYQGQTLRAAVLERREPRLQIVVALTTTSRSALLRRLVTYSIAPQVLLLLGLVAWLRRAVNRDLQPLSQLQELVETRDAADLSPLPRGLLAGAASRDVHGLASAIDALLGRVAEGLAAQREFAGNVAHELRTPLAGIRALAEYGLAQHDPARWREQLQAVLESQQRASRLVDQLLAVALANETGAALPLKPLDLAAIARQQLLQLLARADKAGMELEASGLDEPAWALGDTALVEGLLANLLDNALRYGRGPEARGHIRLELGQHAGHVVLTVTDAGPGIGAALRESLKTRWRQGHEGTRLGQGAGLGLAIVQRYAELMQADFRLDAGPGGLGLCASVAFRSPDAAKMPPR